MKGLLDTALTVKIGNKVYGACFGKASKNQKHKLSERVRQVDCSSALLSHYHCAVRCQLVTTQSFI